MPKITVISRNGSARDVEAENGLSLMEVIRDNGFDELLALCGGVCSCATCHVHVDSAYFNRLEAISEDEDGLLSGSEHRRENSRLSCQVRLTGELGGMRVTIAPED